MIRPLGNRFLFVFINDTNNGLFVSRNKGKVIIPLTPELDHQGTRARWAKVLAVGRKVDGFTAGDVVVISPGKWTIGFKHDDMRIWQSDDEWVLGVGDESMAYDYGAGL